MLRKLLLTLLLVGAAAAASAQNDRNSDDNWNRKKKTRVKVEWGALAGINIPDYNTDMSGTDIRNKLGWQAGMTVALDMGAWAVEPQILYVRQGLRIRPEEMDEINLRSNSIDVPVLASFRMLKPVRIYVGPVFTVMNDCKQKSGSDLLDFGRVRPTLSFTAGVGVKLRHYLVDLRYNGQFRAKRDVILPDGTTTLNKLRTYNFALSVGYLF